MRAIDKIELIKKIANELLERYSEDEILSYFKMSGCKKIASSYDWDTTAWTKHVLTDTPENILLNMESELFNSSQRNVTPDSNLWVPGHFRLFLSHVSSFKVNVAILQKELKKYAISSFVAHKDIQPTKEWIVELENALLSMDALAALLTEGFDKSSWTDHEIGAAIGRELLVIPVKKDLDPYGFIGKIQALPTVGKTIADVAKDIYVLLCSHQKTRTKIFQAISSQFIFSTSLEDAKHLLGLLEEQKNIPLDILESIRTNIGSNFLILWDSATLKRTNDLLKKHGIANEITVPDFSTDNDEIPF